VYTVIAVNVSLRDATRSRAMKASDVSEYAFGGADHIFGGLPCCRRYEPDLETWMFAIRTSEELQGY
jgi:hypothetical protein